MIGDDDLLRIAEEAGFVVTKGSVSIDYDDYTPEIKKLSELVENAVREKCAQEAAAFGPGRPIVSRNPSERIKGRWEGEQAASSSIAAEIRKGIKQ